MACLRARVFSRRCSNAASSASISISTSAMAVCSARGGTEKVKLLHVTSVEVVNRAARHKLKHLRFLIANDETKKGPWTRFVSERITRMSPPTITPSTLTQLALAKPLGVTSDVGISTSFATERNTPSECVGPS